MSADKLLRQIPEAEPVKAESAELPDPFALGKAKLAEFWPIYVKEADEYDKELSEGWNKLRFLLDFDRVPILTLRANVQDA